MVILPYTVMWKTHFHNYHNYHLSLSSLISLLSHVYKDNFPSAVKSILRIVFYLDRLSSTVINGTVHIRCAPVSIVVGIVVSIVVGRSN